LRVENSLKLLPRGVFSHPGLEGGGERYTQKKCCGSKNQKPFKKRASFLDTQSKTQAFDPSFSQKSKRGLSQIMEAPRG